MNNLWKHKFHHYDKKFYKDYLLGITVGFCSKLAKQRKEFSQELNALILLKDAKLNDFISQNMNVTGTRKEAEIVDQRIFNRGIEKGKEIEIAEGLGGSKNRNVLRLN